MTYLCMSQLIVPPPKQTAYQNISLFTLCIIIGQCHRKVVSVVIVGHNRAVTSYSQVLNGSLLLSLVSCTSCHQGLTRLSKGLHQPLIDHKRPYNEEKIKNVVIHHHVLLVCLTKNFHVTKLPVLQTKHLELEAFKLQQWA